MRFIKSLILTVLLLFLGISIYKIDIEEFIVSDTRGVYINSNISKLDYSELRDIFEIEDSKWKDIERYKKLVKTIGVISFDTIDKKLDGEVLVVDLGIAYLYGAKDYYEKNGEYYILKEECRDQDLKIINYMKKYRGYILTGESPNKIEKVIDGIGTKNQLIGEKIKKTSVKYGTFVQDLRANEVISAQGVEVIAIELDYSDGFYNAKTNIYGQGKIFDIIEKQPISKKLGEYIENDRIYISGEDMGGFLFTLISNLKIKEVDAIINLSSLLGLDIGNILDDVDSEVVVDLRTKEIVVPLKETKKAEKLLKFFGGSLKVGRTPIELDGNLLKSRGISKNSKNVELDREVFIYGKVSEDILGYDGNELVEIEGRVLPKSIEILSSIPRETLVKIIKKQ